jgi:hypothetical protein
MGKIISEKEIFKNVSQSQKSENCISRYCIFNPTKCPLIINIHRETDKKQILCNLNHGWTFFTCVIHLNTSIITVGGYVIVHTKIIGRGTSGDDFIHLKTSYTISTVKL